MGSGIQWTDRTWNPVVGCTPVSPGCLNCYAATMAVRLEGMGTKGYEPREIPGYSGTPYDAHTPARTVRIVEKRAGRAVFTGDVRLVPDKLTEPLKWKKPAMVFVNSMSDLFHESVPFDYVDQVMAVIALCPQHNFQALTKRPERMAEYFGRTDREREDRDESVFGAAFEIGEANGCVPDWPVWFVRYGRGGSSLEWPLPNLWLGTSVENQKAAETRIPHLLKCPAAVRFLSVEPLLGEIDLRKNIGGTQWMGGQRGHGGRHQGIGTPDCPREWHHHCDDRCQPGIDWVICGGESGPDARPSDVAWHRSILRQCRDAGVPFFEKQLGAYILCNNQHIADWEDQTDGAAYTRHNPDRPTYQGDIERVYVGDKKGGDMAEWPEDLRVREWPKGIGEAQSTEHK